MAYDQSVRTLMNNSGYDNSKIGYDGNSGQVTYNNQPFMKPQMNVNGTAYTDQSSFDQAHNQYKQQYPDMHPSAQANPTQGGMFKSTEDSMPYDQQMAFYAQNPTAANTELSRAQKVLGYHQAMGNTEDANSAMAHIGRLQQVMGPQQAQSQGPDVNGLVNSVYQRVMTPDPYDVYSSPEYKAAQAANTYQTGLATRGAQESMGESGFGRSTNLADRAQMIGNDANMRLMTQVVPQLLQQHREIEQQKTGNLMGIVSPLMQQQQNNIANTGRLANGQLSFPAQQQAIQNAIARAGAFGTITNPEDAQLLGVPLGTSTRELQALLYKNQYQKDQLGLKQESNDIARTRAGNQTVVDKARANYYNSQTGTNKNSEAARTMSSQVFDHAQDFTSAQDVQDYFKANGKELSKTLGADATTKLKNDFLSQFNTDDKNSTAIYDRAFAAAQRDGDWSTLSPEEQDARVTKYQTMLEKKGKTGN